MDDKDLPVRAPSDGDEMYDLARRLFPICRSITGDGVRETLGALRERLPIEIHEVKTGTQVFDWTVPKEWNIRDAYILDCRGQKVIDFRNSNLHVLNYSVPIRARVSNEELKKHLFSLPDRPDWIPYRTSYYSENWGFCVSHNQYLTLTEPEYDVVIDSELKDGHMTYGEYYKPGASKEEVLFSCHVCHPSLCNDNLSGIALTVQLARWLSGRDTRYSYRFLFIPGTIGSITWLSLNESKVDRIKHGLVVVCVGDDGDFTYKKSRRGDSEIDRIVLNVLKSSGRPHKVIDFYPYGYDERQYCSPGFNLAVGSLSRTTHGEYPEYHTSADDLSFVKPVNLADSFDKYCQIIDALESNYSYRNLSPKCEPQLGKRGLYGGIGAEDKKPVKTMTLLWVLNLSDGAHSLLDISERSGVPMDEVAAAADALAGAGLLARA
ncbi:MAG: DUF4910 domain-containing protein [Gammaproteobacteria bacterium]|nr:DUF4910 domain-containing protein [Gammaproteobacteria bacterium]